LSETVSAYTVVQADGTSLDLPPRSQTVLTAGDEAVPPDGDDLTNGAGDVLATVPGVFAVWQDVDPNSVKSFATWWLPRLQGRIGRHAELGFKMVRVEFSWPDDGGFESDPPHPHGPWGTKWEIRRADVIEELTLEDVEALAA
jgi:hypothetical protein